ncbi:MAG TPA: peptidoglycan bridge formation glycyltransferase FemA/FemB family protein [Candidatus Cloacimonadota bacterium]|nr:peptidoglycan bridge formation glycyltransferase FemA/FemB family protein [Candidatus Cloacimonadota bacterium]HQL14404.1 peptidoglycan bridge formation glycyltransferase FemA/FemB family protein [Candidatus Cloacimonadota bacterium]
MDENKLRIIRISEKFNDLGIEEWADYVAQHTNGNIFHHPLIYKANEYIPDYKPLALVALDENNDIQALLTGFIHNVKGGLLSFLSRRLILLQPPLYSDLSALDIVLKTLINECSKEVVYIEVRNSIPFDNQAKEIYKNNGFIYKTHLNFIVDCSDPHQTWYNISESKRRQIKKAQKNGAIIIEEPKLSQVREYYLILQNFYRNKLKKPLPPFSYFEILYNNKYEEYETKFLLIEFQNKIIGGMVCPISAKKTIHEHYIVGLDKEYKDEYPSVLATWAAIDYACRHGIQFFDFMGAGEPNIDYGVREFKSKFGGQLCEPGRYLFVHSNLKYNLAKYGFSLYQKLIG